MSSFNPLPIFILITLFLVYVSPAFIAWKRHIRDRLLIICLDLLLGWLVVPWILSLVLACIWPVDTRDER